MGNENNIMQTNNSSPKRFLVYGVEFIYVCIIAICASFLGWIAENAAKLVTSGIIDSRFHILPFISPYGLVTLGVFFVLGNPNKLSFLGRPVFKEDSKKAKLWSNLISLLVIYAVVFFGELIIGNMWDAFFGVELWNYLSMPLHVTQYAGLIPTLLYGTGAFLLFKFAFWPSIKLLQKKGNYKVCKIIVCTLGSLLILDTLWLMLQIIIWGKAPLLWQINLW